MEWAQNLVSQKVASGIRLRAISLCGFLVQRIVFWPIVALITSVIFPWFCFWNWFLGKGTGCNIVSLCVIFLVTAWSVLKSVSSFAWSYIDDLIFERVLESIGLVVCFICIGEPALGFCLVLIILGFWVYLNPK